MTTTAKNHFDDDIARAFALREKANTIQAAGELTQLPEDIRGAAVAMAVGTMDAYFCDKYVDCLTKALQSYSAGTWNGTFPSAFRQQLLPAGEVLDASRPRRPKWGIRMAVKAVMEKDNMYSLSRLNDAFNGILPIGQKLWSGMVPQLLALGRRRFTRHLNADLATLNGKPLQDAEKEVIASVKKRISVTVQFRHDWIHNCARPKGVILNYTDGQARAAMNEIKNLVNIFEAHIEAHRLA
jgi:hypothetical protein